MVSRLGRSPRQALRSACESALQRQIVGISIMAHLRDYIVLRIVAVGMASGLTGYNAWLSWSHFGEPSGPIAAVTGAGLFVFSEYAWRDRQWLRALLLLGLGALELVISETAVLHRVSATQEAHLQLARSNNLPRVEADKALTDAKEAWRPLRASAALDVAFAVRAWSSGKKPPGSGWSRPAPS